jgi:hypothetical protein
MEIIMGKASCAGMSDNAKKARIRAWVHSIPNAKPNGAITRIKSEIKGYEKKYKISSTEIENAISSGKIKENEELVRWIMCRNMLRATGKSGMVGGTP